jgi:hypothetical protein
VSPEALQIKGLLKLPAKKAKNKTYMNQALVDESGLEITLGTASLPMAHRSTSFVHK